MTIRILPTVGDVDLARSLSGLLSQLPGVEPFPALGDSTALLDTLATLAGASIEELPEVVLVYERIGPLPALEVVREIALRFPAVGVVLVTADAGPALYSAAMDAGARGICALPPSYDELATRTQAAAQWAMGVRRHLGGASAALTPGPGGRLVAVAGAKGGVGTTLTAVQLALAARAAGQGVVLVDMDLQAGDVASYLDVQFRRSIADLAQISDITPRVLQEAVFPHPSGLGLLLAPGEGERGEEVTDLVSRQAIAALRARYDLVIIDCGTQMSAANTVAIETADLALLITTPDVVTVRAAKRMVRLWDRLQIRKAEETTTVVNRYTRSGEIQPSLVERATGTKTARTTVPAAYKELQPAIDSGRMQDLDSKSTIRQALWALAGEIGLIEGSPAAAGPPQRGGRGSHADRSVSGLRRRRALGGGSGTGGRAGADTSTGQPSGGAGGHGTGGYGTGGRAGLGPGGAEGAGGGVGHIGPPGSPQQGGGDPGGTGPDALTQVPTSRFRKRGGGDRGQVTIEFLGMVPLILIVLVVLWQCVLIGYTYSLAGNSADRGARAATATDTGGAAACEEAALQDLPDAWRGDASISCPTAGGVVRATVRIKVPVLFPGAGDFPWTVTGTAGAAEEE
ncbi:AAA family ATPase [Streptomyces zagrosensis]|uniref:Pilus assembly protein CpaE n=1 Tax=Streptomyces zagrosensis TaxID=1042984 RepID=A0A7W9V1W6_9ACTN|nr:AAA family ATPase [Streptomyces zagrosensis]MBB5938204.1 pilus assembly protein CpaE [Streptomyces zagrosensis]